MTEPKETCRAAPFDYLGIYSQTGTRAPRVKRSMVPWICLADE